ncbi:hypothetical protein [Endozoicomonas sp. SCSIO W0465]|uniref:hypothetical protein n=1 Tax=Endozoicomonas sp. SCSIO W0465 TaxID=2918516 RepID=UPI0020765B08|nr:hypothetical protein [Endozoicomonas sp. SCSIO W0465]USE33819.1 hypothetical protein MJO57_16725 [Endozoicomonas sp. SCSIO W0465]
MNVPSKSTPVLNNLAFITSPATDATEPLPDNSTKPYFSGHRVQAVDRENSKKIG